MNKKILWALLLSIAITIPAVGFAEDSDNESSAVNAGASVKATTTRRIINTEAAKSRKEAQKQAVKEIKDARIQTRSSVKEAKVEAREDIKKERKEFRGEIKNIRATATISADEKKNKIEEEWKKKQSDLGKIRDERNKKIREIRTNTQKTILEKREALKTDLKKISDQRKAQIVEKTDKKLEKINGDRTGHLFDVFNRLEKTLAKINVRIGAAEAKGVNVSSAKKASDDAAKAIASARTAVEAQAAKVYKMTITTENKLKVDVGNTIQKLQNDLKQLRITVQSAHDAVRKTAVALAKAMGIEDKPKSSSSSSISSSVSSSSSVSTSSSSSVTSSASSSSEVSSSSSVSSSVSSEAASSQSSS